MNKSIQGRTGFFGIFAVFYCSILILTANTASAHSKTETLNRKIYTVKLNSFQKEMRILHSLKLDVAGVDIRRNLVDLTLTPQELAQAQAKLPTLTFSPAPNQLTNALDKQYQTPEKIEKALRDYVQRFPDLAKLVEVGKSGEGRSIWALKITDNPTKREIDEPTILFNSMHHAREIMTPEVCLDIIDQLLTQYSNDPKMKNYVNHNEIWVLPMLNVDGNNIVWTKNAMQRKNANEVDINRNYPFNWGKCNGSSGSKFSQDYRGPSAGSEAETKVMMDLVSKIKPVFDISFHSYSELVIYPFGCDKEKPLTKEVVEKIGKDMAALLPVDHGSGTYEVGTSWEILYTTDGTDIDWMYNEHGVIPFVIEVNSRSEGFQPSYETWREPTVKKMRAAWMMLLDRLDGSGIRGQIVDSAKSAPLQNARISIERPGESPQIQKVLADGSFQVVLNPGTYQVEFQADGYVSQKQTFNVSAKRMPALIKLQQAK